MPRLYIVGMVKDAVDNCGHLGRVNPLNRLERSNRRAWEQDQNTFDRKLAERIYRDMQAFIVRRYPGVRWLVLAEVLLTIGAKCAAKAGVGDDEIVEFVHRHKVLRGDPSEAQHLRVPIAGGAGEVSHAGGATEHAITTEGAD